MNNISVAIIAKDAEHDLPRCLKSVDQLCQDVVVVVDETTKDNTEEVANNLGARVYRRKFDNFSAQKNYAVSLTKNGWVLALDADEAVTPNLCDEIRSTLVNTDCDGFILPRVNYIFGKEIKHTNWSSQSDAHVWLFRKSKAIWEGQVHEHVRVRGKLGKLKHPKIHWNYRTVDQFIAKLNLYTTLESQNKKFNPLMVIIYPVWKFIRHYILFLGFLDGWHGLALSYLMAVYGLVIYVKAWQNDH